MEYKRDGKSQVHIVCDECLNSNPDVQPIDDIGLCPVCKSSLEQIVKNSRLGCATCYDHFEEPLIYIISAVQFGSEIKHVGTVPESFKKHTAEAIEPLKLALEMTQNLKIAVKNEDYDKAAKIKEAIADLKPLLVSFYEKGELDPYQKTELAEIAYKYIFPESA